MFAQVIQGKVTDRDVLKQALDRWLNELAPNSIGWLGSTGGVTEDGRFIVLARFSSEEEAMQNSSRPEQDAWWAETSRLFDGEPVFKNSTAVDTDISGDPDRAGFVQFVIGKTSDTDRARELMRQDPIQKWAELRPDLIGTVTAIHADGEMTTAAYFTSEQQAREGEKKEIPPELMKGMEEMNALMVGEPEYFDLKDPWLDSPKG